jgi:hypothetical protein
LVLKRSATVVRFVGMPYAESGGIQSTMEWCMAKRPVRKDARDGEQTSCA